MNKVNKIINFFYNLTKNVLGCNILKNIFKYFCKILNLFPSFFFNLVQSRKH